MCDRCESAEIRAGQAGKKAAEDALLALHVETRQWAAKVIDGLLSNNTKLATLLVQAVREEA